MLRAAGYRLQTNVKVREGGQHPDRDAQFRYLNEQTREHRDEELPVISVDAKKKELVGEYKGVGREWQLNGEPAVVNVHDFIDPPLGRPSPTGLRCGVEMTPALVPPERLATATIDGAAATASATA